MKKLKEDASEDIEKNEFKLLKKGLLLDDSQLVALINQKLTKASSLNPLKANLIQNLQNIFAQKFDKSNF